MTEKRFKDEFLEEMNEIKKEKSEIVTVDDIIGIGMTEKRFEIKVPFLRSKQQVIIDNVTQKSTIVDCYDDNIDYFVECLNNLHEEKEELIDALNQRTEQCDKLYEEISNYEKSQKEALELIREQRKFIDELYKENEQLKSEINMLKTTIGRNEAYIERLTHKGEWR